MSTTTELKQISEMTASEIADMMEHGCVKMENVAPMYVRAIELLRRSVSHGESKVPQFIVRDAERAIDAATNPKGMHTNGPAMARIEASRLAALLRYAQMNSSAPAQAGSAESGRGEQRKAYVEYLKNDTTLTDEEKETALRLYDRDAALSAQGQQSEDAK